jgi:hypothetical protein
MTSSNQEDIELATKKIVETCSKGIILNFSKYIPDVTIHAYNRLIYEAGFIVGWKDKDKHIIDSTPLIKNLQTADFAYNKSRTNLLNRGFTEETINRFSPVFIVSASLIETEKNMLLSLASSHIYSSIALLELSNFRELCGRLLDQYTETITEEETMGLITAHARLVVAQEAVSLAYQIMYKADDAVRSKICSIEEVTLQLEYERALSTEALLQQALSNQAELQQKTEKQNKKLQEEKSKVRSDRVQGGKNSKLPPVGFDEAYKKCVERVLNLDKDKQLYMTNLASLSRDLIFDKAAFYSIEWKNDPFSVDWFVVKLKEIVKPPAYLSSKKGKQQQALKTTISKIKDELLI